VRIASQNLRVPREEFLAVWDAASRRNVERGEAGGTDWGVAAVVATCRWMAAVPMRTALCGGLPRSPVTLQGCRARGELIEAEWQAAQADDFAPVLAARPGWCDGVRATLRWAWRRDGPPPIEVVPAQPRDAGSMLERGPNSGALTSHHGARPAFAGHDRHHSIMSLSSTDADGGPPPPT
jgi:hypothetical protein